MHKGMMHPKRWKWFYDYIRVPTPRRIPWRMWMTMRRDLVSTWKMGKDAEEE